MFNQRDICRGPEMACCLFTSVLTMHSNICYVTEGLEDAVRAGEHLEPTASLVLRHQSRLKLTMIMNQGTTWCILMVAMLASRVLGDDLTLRFEGHPTGTTAEDFICATMDCEYS